MAKYNEYFKLMVVMEYLEGEVGLSTLAKKHSIRSKEQVRQWVKIYEKFGSEELVRKFHNVIYFNLSWKY